jgi:hypothetical protein
MCVHTLAKLSSFPPDNGGGTQTSRQYTRETEVPEDLRYPCHAYMLDVVHG